GEPAFARAGTGTLCRGRDVHPGRRVAIKILAPAMRSDAARLARFMNEARTTALVTPPNIVGVIDLGCEAGRPFVVSELLEGETLRARLRRGRLSPDVATPYALETPPGLIA